MSIGQNIDGQNNICVVTAQEKKLADLIVKYLGENNYNKQAHYILLAEEIAKENRKIQPSDLKLQITEI